MGKFDSSRTRVVPVFDALVDRDPGGRSWLAALLRLGFRSAGRIGTASEVLLPNHPRWWGRNERRLHPPKELLRWLVRHALPPASESDWGSGVSREKRRLLVERDPGTIKEALRLLEGPRRFPPWYLLEGSSHPDAWLETEDFILVIEGKRTERKATRSTTWIPNRNQMIRHMDAAWEVGDGKRVLGLMIVEGPGPADAVDPSMHWLSEADAQVLPRALEESLPHRIPEEREQIANGFLGVTTWQKVCRESGLDWPPATDL